MSNLESKRKRSDSTEGRPNKRRKLGYHRYQNGMLNVEPKNQHLELAQKNARDSPLLRLPQELRDMIWAYVFAETTIMTTTLSCTDLDIKLSASHIDVQVPQTCRQVYSETILLPFRENLFSTATWEMYGFPSAISQIPAAHRAHITKLEVFAEMFWNFGDREDLLEATKTLASLLPNLKHIAVSPMEVADIDGIQREQRMVDVIRFSVEALMAHFAEAKIVLSDCARPISEKTRVAIFGLDAK